MSAKPRRSANASHSPSGGRPALRCAIYTRVSTEHGLEQEFNSLDNQREAAEAYVKSQAHEGWRCLPERYDDGGFSGGTLDRPALQRLLDAVRERRVDVIVVYKVDRLTRALADFAKLVELFDAHGVSFVSVTQAFNTTTSMGRLTLNVLLSFAQFEREVTGERIRDKIAASKRKGIWMGGVVPLGYRVEARALHVVEEHAALVREVFANYLALGTVEAVVVGTLRGLVPPEEQFGDDAALVAGHLIGVAVHPDRLVLSLTGGREAHTVAWSHQPHRVRRAIIVPPGREGEALRPMKQEDRARILLAIAKGRSWMQGLIAGRIPGTAAIAVREKVTERSVRMTLSLAHLAPSIVRAIVDARLPRGIGLRHLSELPASWAEQERILGM